MPPAVESARSLLLESFAWTNGDADFSGVLKDGAFLAAVGPALAAPFADDHIAAVVVLEARGFVFGALAARALDVGLVLARKPGSVLPGALSEAGAYPDWRGHVSEMRISRGAVARGDRLLLVDDWIETGAQATTVDRLVTGLGGRLVGVSVVVDDTDDEVRDRLNVRALIKSRDLPAEPSR